MANFKKGQYGLYLRLPDCRIIFMLKSYANGMTWWIDISDCLFLSSEERAAYKMIYPQIDLSELDRWIKKWNGSSQPLMHSVYAVGENGLFY